MDHNPLRYLETSNLGAVEQRRVSQLPGFNFEVHYKLGRLNKNADVLSCVPVALESEIRDTERFPGNKGRGSVCLFVACL